MIKQIEKKLPFFNESENLRCVVNLLNNVE